jgi:spore maturation protein CgeB
VDLSWYQYDDFDMLKQRIDFYLANEGVRERIRKHGHDRVKAGHTYAHRWAEILWKLGLK